MVAVGNHGQNSKLAVLDLATGHVASTTWSDHVALQASGHEVLLSAPCFGSVGHQKFFLLRDQLVVDLGVIGKLRLTTMISTTTYLSVICFGSDFVN